MRVRPEESHKHAKLGLARRGLARGAVLPGPSRTGRTGPLGHCRACDSMNPRLRKVPCARMPGRFGLQRDHGFRPSHRERISIQCSQCRGCQRPSRGAGETSACSTRFSLCRELPLESRLQGEAKSGGRSCLLGKRKGSRCPRGRPDPGVGNLREDQLTSVHMG